MVPTKCTCAGRLYTTSMTKDEEAAQRPDAPCAAFRCVACGARTVVDDKGRPAAAMASVGVRP
jgi:hypothetical protein